MSAQQRWDTELYEANHAFVWQMGQGILDLLKPQVGESILDLGCGTGQLTDRIASCGARVTGFDSSPEMVGQARQNYPKLRFMLGDAADVPFESEFDAVFSNAALHWMLDAPRVAAAVAKALKPGGRLVAEFGGKGNIQAIAEAIEKVLGEQQGERNYFPSIPEYGAVLERAGLELQWAQLFARPAPWTGGSGRSEWLRQFRWTAF